MSMRETALPALLIALFLAAGTPARAANCSAVAEQAAAQYGAEIVSVKEKGGTCIIRLWVPGEAGQPPRVIPLELPG
jgi:hypothetical protein